MSDVKTFDNLAFWTRGDFMLGLWNAPARMERAPWLYDLVDQVIAVNPGGVVMLQFVLETASPPDGPTREENHTRLRKWAPSLRRLVTVPVGPALWATVVGTIMRGMFVFTGQGKTQVVARSAKEGLDVVLRDASPRTPPRREIEDGIDALFRALGAPRPA